MYKKIDLFYTLLHVPVDALAIIFAFMVSYWLRGEGGEIYRLPFEDYMPIVYASVPLWLVIFVLQGMYTRRYLFGTLQNMAHLAVSVLAGWASFVVYLVFLRNEQTLVFPRLMLIYIPIFGFLFIFVGRLLLRLIQTIGRSFGLGKRRVMILGKGQLAESLEADLLERRDPGVNFIKRVDSAEVTELVGDLKKYKIDDLILADNTLGDAQILEYFSTAQNNGVVCHLVPNLFEVQASNVLFSNFAGMPMLTFRQTPLDGWGRIVKRLIDIIASLAALVLLSPVFLLIAAIIKITDPGPVVYGHKRLGRGGRPFKMFKFRTMQQKYCAGPGFSGKSELEIFREMGRDDLIEEFKRDHKVKDDPRISTIGKILRKTSLDELPQFFNILKGDLSLVGPRPIVEAELPKYGRWGSYLLSIKPGATGLWQVSGRNDVSYEERVRLDAHYVQNWSLWQDFVIVIKTFLTVIIGKTGY
jgi:exopolysaccharide biosynthesis polyprenyl glycosylphosphotransferase